MNEEFQAQTTDDSSTNADGNSVSHTCPKPIVGGSFICQGCKCDLDEVYSLRTKGFCYLCDPNITLEELLSDNEIN